MQETERGDVDVDPRARVTGAATAQPEPAGTTRRIFVVGNSRSGTTMLARMLGRHSQVHALQELHFVEELWMPADDGPLTPHAATALADRLLHNQREWYHTEYRAGSHRDVAAEIVEPLPAPVRPTDVFAAVLEHEARRAGKRLPVEQTPRNVFYLGQLLDSLPDSRAVVLTRDPRDVLLSQKNWWRRRFRGTTGVPAITTLRQWADYHPITTSLLWRGGVRAGMRLSSDPRVTAVRFEDLVTEPEVQLARVLDPLDLVVEPAMLDAPRISSSNTANRGGRGVDPSVVGGWRHGLSPSEVWISQYLTRAEAQALDHGPAPGRTPWIGLAGQALSWAPRTALAVVLNRARTRNLLTSAKRRLRA